MLSVVLDFFSSGGKIDAQNESKFSSSEEEIKYSKQDKEIVKKINELLDERIKPAVAQDGGDINFVSFKIKLFFLS